MIFKTELDRMIKRDVKILKLESNLAECVAMLRIAKGGLLNHPCAGEYCSCSDCGTSAKIAALLAKLEGGE